MKLSTKIILPIILISALAILLVGCGGVTTPSDESPGFAPGTITGIIAAPCCENSAELADGDNTSPEYWCFNCQNNWNLQDGIEVVLTYGENKVATTTTNEFGEYTFTNVDPGKNYVVTAYCPNFTDNRPLVKDVALELIEGGYFDTKITDIVSTSLGLVVDFLVTYTEMGPEDISLNEVITDKTNFHNFPKFRKLVYEVRKVVENCEVNLLTDDDVQYALCLASEEVGRVTFPDLVIGCEAGYAPTSPGPGPTPVPDPCDLNTTAPVINKVTLGDGVTISPVPDPPSNISLVVGKSYTVVISASDDDNILPQPYTYRLTITKGTDPSLDIDMGNNNTFTGPPLVVEDIGTYVVYVYVSDGCAETKWGPVTIIVDCCPFGDPGLTINLEQPKGIEMSRNSALGPLCMNDCATISSVTVHYASDPPGFEEISDLNDPRLDWTWDPAEIKFDPTVSGDVCLADSANPGTYTITATYTDYCERSVEDSLVVTFEDCTDYTVTLSDKPIGAAATLTGGGTKNAGDSVTIGTTANNGYTFVNWTDDDNSNAVVSSNASSTFTMPPKDLNYTAHFTANIFILGTVTIAFEDLEIPKSGRPDYDYNDWVAGIDIETLYDGDTPNLTQVKFEVTPLARGAGYDHRFHIEIPGGIFDKNGTWTLSGDGVTPDSGDFNATTGKDFEIISDTRASLGSEHHNHTNTLECEGPTSPDEKPVLIILFDEPFYHDFSQYDPYIGGSMHGQGLFFDPYLEIDQNSSDWKYNDPPEDSVHTEDYRMLTVPGDWSWPEEGEAIWDVYTTGVTDDDDPPEFTTGWWTSPNNCAYDGNPCGGGTCLQQ